MGAIKTLTLYSATIERADGMEDVAFAETVNKEQAELEIYRENEPCRIIEIEEMF